MNMLMDYDAEINETADSLKPHFENEGNENYNEAAILFSKFYHEKLIKSPSSYQ
jgi:hypothetical protein